MNIRTFLTISAIIAALFGLAFILFPAALVSLYGVGLDPVGVYVAQLFGAVLLAIAVINWTARDIREPAGILLGNFVADTLGFIISLVNQINLTSGINSLGWLTILLYLFLAVGFGYYRFVTRGTLGRVTR